MMDAKHRVLRLSTAELINFPKFQRAFERQTGTPLERMDETDFDHEIDAAMDRGEPQRETRHRVKSRKGGT